LPNAPGVRGAQQAPDSHSAQQPGLGSISGAVTDTNGGVISGATVKLVEEGNLAERVAEPDGAGHFIFVDVAPGLFTISINAPGFAAFVSPRIPLRAGEKYELAPVVVRITATFDVQVLATQNEIAQEQVTASEKQRAFLILPNFYTSYLWNAAPLSSKQKFGLAVHDVIDPGTFLSAGAVAGIEQAADILPGYGQGAKGYAKRFGAATGDSWIARILGSAALPSLLHQDPRYFYKGTGSTRSRFLYAAEMAVMCRGDNGRIQPNYSHVGGSFAAGAISNLYHAAADRGVGLTMMQSVLDLTGRVSNNLIQEFLLRKVTSNVPPTEDGQKGNNDTQRKTK
jgi:hypothetical protein